MEYQVVKNLIERYFRGETTLEEEASLREYFRAGPVDERCREYAALFRWMSREQDRQLEDQRAGDMFRQLEPTGGKTVSMRVVSRQWILRIAAALVLMAGMWWTYQGRRAAEQTAEVDWSKYEITSEQEALMITRGALLKASQSLNKGANAAAGQMDRMQEIGRFFK
jgi:hypothetical protein